MSYQTVEEASHGETYQNKSGTFTVYEIGVYKRGSVLEGQQKRTWLDQFDSLEEAQTAYPEAQLISGSTYREPSLGHLPDDERGDW